MIPFVEFKGQFKSIEQEIRAAVDDVLQSGWYILGRHCTAFEEEFAAYVGVRHAVGVGSGTEAIHLALTAAGVGPGDEIITVANTCVPTVAGISASGATPAFVDIDPVTCTMDPSKLEAAMTERTKAIVPVHLYGHPCDMDPIMAVAEKHDIVVVEDCAQAHGAEYRGRRCGTFGTAAAFSFYPTKNLGAYGDGGCVTTNSDALDKELRMLRNYGEEVRYHHSVRGFNSRLDEIQAAILRVKLKHLDEWNDARRERACAYGKHLQGLPIALPVEAPWGRHIYHLFVVRTPQRDRLQKHLHEREIGALLHYPIPIHLQKAFADLNVPRGALPETEKACDEVISLPLYPELPFESIEQIACAVAEFFN